MKRDQFIAQRSPSWKRLEELVVNAESRRRPKLSAEEVTEFSSLLRAVSYDLSLVRSRDWGLGISRYLNRLVARGHNCFYRTRPGSWTGIYRFLARDFPVTLRENAVYFYVALFLFVVPGLISGLVVAMEPSLAGRLIPESFQQMFEQMYSEQQSSESSGSETVMAGFYIRNNIGIAFRCFATGIFFGLGSVFFLVYNSLFIGTLTGFLIATGHADRFLTFVVSHGSFELTAIVISGAGGLIIGHALVHPGPYSRADALRRRGLVGVKLALGAGAMLAVAALIEAFWSPSALPKVVKVSGGAVFWVLVILYLTRAGRTVESNRHGTGVPSH